jgi:RNA polymerase sigma factor (sigma-70 family)
VSGDTERAAHEVDKVEHELVARAQRGDENALADIAYAIGDRFFTVAHRILRDIDLAEDATQQAIVAIWRQLPGLRDPARFEAWSYRVLVNECYAQARSERRWSPSLHVLDTDHGAGDPQLSVADRDQLERGFRRLPREQRAVLVRQHYLDLTLPQIAELLGVPIGPDYDVTREGTRVLIRPIISVDGVDAVPYLEQPGFVDGRYSEFSNDQSGLLFWAALFETVEDAERALPLYVEEVQSEDGHGLRSRVDVELKDEGAHYDDEDPARDAQVYLWRVGNLLLAAATYGDFDPDELRSVAERMDDNAR